MEQKGVQPSEKPLDLKSLGQKLKVTSDKSWKLDLPDSPTIDLTPDLLKKNFLPEELPDLQGKIGDQNGFEAVDLSSFHDEAARASWKTDLTQLTEADDGRLIRSSDRFLIHAIAIEENPMHQMRRRNVLQAAGAYDHTQVVNLDEDPLGISRIRLLSTSLISGEKDTTWESHGLILQPKPEGIIQTNMSDAGTISTNVGHKHEVKPKPIVSVSDLYRSTSSHAYNEVNVRGDSLDIVGFFVRVYPDGTPMLEGHPGREAFPIFNSKDGPVIPATKPFLSGMERAQEMQRMVFEATGKRLPIIIIEQPFSDISDRPTTMEHYDYLNFSKAEIHTHQKNFRFDIGNDGRLGRYYYTDIRGFIRKVTQQDLEVAIEKVNQDYPEEKPENIQILLKALNSELEKRVKERW